MLDVRLVVEEENNSGGYRTTPSSKPVKNGKGATSTTAETFTVAPPRSAPASERTPARQSCRNDEFGSSELGGVCYG